MSLFVGVEGVDGGVEGVDGVDDGVDGVDGVVRITLKERRKRRGTQTAPRGTLRSWFC